MFVTDATEEFFEQSPGYRVSDLRKWTRVDTCDAWFQFEVADNDDPSQSHMILLSNPLELWKLTRAFYRRNGEVVSPVWVNTPGNINGSGSWRKDQLLELVIYSSPHDGSAVLIYIPDAGR